MLLLTRGRGSDTFSRGWHRLWVSLKKEKKQGINTVEVAGAWLSCAWISRGYKRDWNPPVICGDVLWWLNQHWQQQLFVLVCSIITFLPPDIAHSFRYWYLWLFLHTLYTFDSKSNGTMYLWQSVFNVIPFMIIDRSVSDSTRWSVL